jgi:hypothetical protein
MRFLSAARRTGGLAAATLVAVPLLALAQQSGSSSSSATTSSGGGQRSSSTVSTRSSTSTRDDRARPQGFSVVLVLADLRSVPGEDDVPPAAKKALLDMKEFLPYRSYKLVDASWILCCGNGRTMSRLRGPEEADYEVELQSVATDQSHLMVQFALREAGDDDENPGKPRAANARSIQELERNVAEAQARLEQARAKGTPSHPDVVRLQTELDRAQARLADARAQAQATDQASAERAARGKTANPVVMKRSIMNTSFAMSLGETVVVGTSRLKGNSRALIALLTAVPPRNR